MDKKKRKGVWIKLDVQKAVDEAMKKHLIQGVKEKPKQN